MEKVILIFALLGTLACALPSKPITPTAKAGFIGKNTFSGVSTYMPGIQRSIQPKHKKGKHRA